MKNGLTILLSVALLFGVALSGNAQSVDRAAELVAQLSQNVRSLGNYSVRFTVTVGDYCASGNYTVGGERYALTLGSIEVYGDAECRYEVETSRREVVIDKVDTTTQNLLNNPVSAFDFIGEEYDAVCLAEDAHRAVVRLTPRHPQEQSGSVEVAIDTRTALPKSITYLPSGEPIEIVIDHIGTAEAPPAHFEQSKYEGFEIIDFR